MEDYAAFFNMVRDTPILMVSGNHDSQNVYIQDIIGRPDKTFVQRVGGVAFYLLYVFPGSTCFPEPTIVDAALEFMRANLGAPQDVAHRFVVVHQPVYSNGDFGTSIDFAQKMEAFMDAYGSSHNFRAAFAGHDHHFAAFERTGIMYFITSPSGGPIDPMTDSDYGERTWPATEQTGPLAPIDGITQTYGYQYHLDSKLMQTQLLVNIGEASIAYSAVDLETGAQFRGYDRGFSQ